MKASVEFCTWEGITVSVWVGTQPAGEELWGEGPGGHGGWRVGREPAVLWWPRKPTASWGASKGVWPVGWRMWLSCSTFVQYLEYCIHLCIQDLLEWIQRSTIKMIKRLGQFFYKDRLRKWELFNLEKSLEIPNSPLVLTWCVQERWWGTPCQGVPVLGGVRGKVGWNSRRCTWAWHRCWNWKIFKVPSNPDHSIILWFCLSSSVVE